MNKVAILVAVVLLSMTSGVGGRTGEQSIADGKHKPGMHSIGCNISIECFILIWAITGDTLGPYSGHSLCTPLLAALVGHRNRRPPAGAISGIVAPMKSTWSQSCMGVDGRLSA